MPCVNKGKELHSVASQLRFSAAQAVRGAFIFVVCFFVLFVFMDGLHRWYGLGRRIDWDTARFGLLASGVILYVTQTGLIFFQVRSLDRLDQTLYEASQTPETLNSPCAGFVAMEGGVLSWNRAVFVIFVVPETLYAWKAQGSSGSLSPESLAQVQETLKNELLTRDLAAIKGLAAAPGGFVLSRSRIKSVEFSPKRRMSLWTLRYAGTLTITSESGYRRRFALLGDVDGPAIQQMLSA